MPRDPVTGINGADLDRWIMGDGGRTDEEPDCCTMCGEEIDENGDDDLCSACLEGEVED